MTNTRSPHSMPLDQLADHTVDPYQFRIRPRSYSSDFNTQKIHNDLVIRVAREIDIKIDEHVRNELMKLGWIPPEIMTKYKLVLKDEKDYETERRSDS